MAEEETDDLIEKDPDTQVDDDEMDAAEAGFKLGAEDEEDEYSDRPKKKKKPANDDEDSFDDDEVR